MPRNFILFLLLGLAAISEAYATCPCTGQTRLDSAGINGLLNGNTVCAIVGNEKWQEYHSGGRVFELGNVSGGEDVGGWSVSANANGNNATVTYDYGTGGSYTYSVCQASAGAPVDFCGTIRDVTNASVISGKVGCGF